jgi:beta-fructofuranosidase
MTELQPGFHLERGWLNDPHGVTHRREDGRYHLFFQLVAEGVVWQPHLSWGHAVSEDLRDWTTMPPALAPDTEDAGCWSGCLVDEPAAPTTIFYTAVTGDDPAGHQVARVRRATPVDGTWATWRKHDGAIEAPAGLIAFRDPFVLRDGAGWRMVLGAGLPGRVAAAVSFTSEDLRTWVYDGVLASRPSSQEDGVWTGSVWECPQLVEMDGAWVLVVSVWADGETHHVAYSVGALDGGRFTPGRWRRLTEGPPYAATVFRDAADRNAMLFWLRGVEDPEGRWAGAISAPYLVRRTGDELVLEQWSG